MDAATERLVVLGSPIAHSKSPAIHMAAYAELGLAWDFGRDEVQADELEGYLAARTRGWRGFSTTMPLKEEAHRLASILDPVAEESGVVNTLLRLDSEAQPLAGFNTDVGGLAAAIRRHDLDASRTVVLGAGATAVSAVMAARALGADRITVVARRAEAAGALADRFDVDAAVLGGSEASSAARGVSLVISALPAPAGAGLEIPEGLASAPLYDVAYAPWPTPLAEAWLAAGSEAHSGIDMLVEQALLQVRIFVNGDPGAALDGEARVLAAMRAAVES